MRIHVQDFSGHPFQVQLSRALARLGHEVRHTYSGDYVTGHGRLKAESDDPESFAVDAVDAGRPFLKYSVRARLQFEIAYGRAWIKALERDRPDVVLVCNVPLIAMARASRYLRRRRIPTVFWHQDVYSLAMTDEFRRKLPAPVTAQLGGVVQYLERDILRASTAVVAIADTFPQQYRRWGLDLPDVSVIPNWAPVDEITPRERDNDWSAAQWSGDDRIRLLYAGTLGRKHNPELLVELLREVRSRGVDARLVVVTEGQGANDVARAAGADPAVSILPFQPAHALPDVLASGDVLISLLEPEASRFSVPSKVASYLAAGRPVVLLGPSANPVADDLRKAGGTVATPDVAGARASADWIVQVTGDRDRWAELGRGARAFAEERYDITRIVPQFEQVLRRAAGRGSRSG